jgi:hypothetical protein
MVILMDKKCKIILDCFLEQKNPESFRLFFSNDKFTPEILPSEFSYQECCKAFVYLETDGFVRISRTNNGSYISVSLTYQGLNYKKILKQERTDFFVKSIAVPIIVSVLTTGIITGVGYVWGQRAIINGMITAQLSQSPSPTPIQDDTQ